jgi:hypothetical protein
MFVKSALAIPFLTASLAMAHFTLDYPVPSLLGLTSPWRSAH